MKVKTSELIGAALDWAVAKCEGRLPASFDDWKQVWPHYSTNWAQGGPIITREKISIRQWVDVPVVNAYMPNADWSFDAASPLIAAMRCYVASKLGEEIEIPEELI